MMRFIVNTLLGVYCFLFHGYHEPSSSSSSSGFIFTSAIIIRDDVDDSMYRTDEADWPSVFPMDATNKLQKGECGATLIADRYAITAAHCFGRNSKKFRVRIAGIIYEVVKVHKNPCFSVRKDGPNGADVAIIKLNKAPPSNLPRIPVYQWNDEAGQRMELMGWGDTGKAGIKQSQTKEDRTFRVAENIIFKATSNTGEKAMLFYKLDKNGLPREGMAWSGDSGGPLFLTKDGQRYIAGVNSAGDCCKYGSMDGYSRLSVKYNWIEKTMQDDTPANFNCNTLLDEPTGISPSSSPPPPPPVRPPTTKSPVNPPTKSPVNPPTKSPVNPPTKSPVKPPTKSPVRLPTKAPVTSPTTKSPTNNENDDDDDDDVDDDYYYYACVDNDNFAFRNNPKRTCARWVSKKPGKRCNKKWKGKPVWKECPNTCDEC